MHKVVEVRAFGEKMPCAVALDDLPVIVSGLVAAVSLGPSGCSEKSLAVLGATWCSVRWMD